MATMDGAATMRWGWLTLFALVLVVVLTGLLATKLTDREQQSRVARQIDVDRRTAEQRPADKPAVSSVLHSATVETASVPTSDSGGAAAARPRSYSRVDTETLAAARAHADGVDRSNPVSVEAPVSLADERVAHVGAVATDDGTSAVDAHRDAAAVRRVDASTASPVPRIARQPDGRQLPRDTRSAVAQKAEGRADANPMSPSSRSRIAEATPEVAQPSATPRAAPPVPVRSTVLEFERSRAEAGNSPEYVVAQPAPMREPARNAAVATRVTDANAASQNVSRRSSGTDLDASWERREQWLRERLQRPNR